MSHVQTVLAILGGLVVLAGIVGALYAYAGKTASEETIKRLRGERDDYLSRINFIEPRLAAIEEQNRLLRDLHDPSARLERIDGKVEKLLSRQNDTIQLLRTVAHIRPEEP